METQPNPLQHTKRFASLSESDQEQAERITDILTGVWKYPRFNKGHEIEERLMLADDVAQLVIWYGVELVDRAVEYRRQHATRERPMMGELDDWIKARRGPTPLNAAQKKIFDHHDDLKRHPDRYLSVNACILVGSRLGLQRKARREAGNPMTQEEEKQLIRELEEWAFQEQSKAETRQQPA
jgi:hypothetical protein